MGAFMCPYHGWSYGLDGALLDIPHEDGFPDIDKLAHGLAEVTAIETKGMIFILHQEPHINHDKALGLISDVPDILRPDQIIFDQNEIIIEANWKLHLESFLEGYHIKPAHAKTFFPFGYDLSLIHI